MHTPSAPPADAVPGPLGRAARRISRRTTDLLAISLLLMASLTVARRLTQWWREPPPHAAASTGDLVVADLLSDGPAGTFFQVGDRPLLLHRQTVAGDSAVAVRTLAHRCRDVLESAAPTSFFPADDRERALLARLAGRQPFLTAENGRDEVHIIPGPMAIVVGIRHLPGEAASVSQPPATQSLSNPVDPQSRSRVVCWGLAFTSTKNQSTLVTVQPGASRHQAASKSAISLPPRTTRSLAIRGTEGGGFTAFSGAGPVRTWRRHFDGQLLDDGWRTAEEWSVTQEHWTARYVKTDANGESRCEIHLGPSGAGWAGLIQESRSPQP